MSYRLMVIGSDAGAVYDRVFDDIQAQMVGELATQSTMAMDVGDAVSPARVIAEPDESLTVAAGSLRSAAGGFLLAKGLTSVPSPSFDTMGWNLQLAADAGLAVVYALDATGLGTDLIESDIAAFLQRAKKAHATVAGAVLVGASADGVAGDVPVMSSPVTADDVQTLLGTTATAVTPLAFKVDLLTQAGSDPQRIVLPEGDEPRILKAAAELLGRSVAKVILIGDASQIEAAARAEGVDVDGAQIISTSDSQLAPKYAAELARLRAAKGMTLEQAEKTISDPTYFATMMVQMGDADGMVSGARNTTADTIRPALQIIKTRPGTSLVSSAFLMLMPDHVLVLSDCAVVVSPDAEQLSQIALSSAQTARDFGLDPKVALLSYSTGSSGSGKTVDVVRDALQLVHQADPNLAVEGPIQFDAAVDGTVAAQKAPDSPVAGKANVLVFPSLDAGNIAYKAIQRTSGAVAVGPILQGLNKPVNDLSRGATVEDIVNTVAITAIQAAGGKDAPAFGSDS